MKNDQTHRVFFICTGNAGRSQMAERLFRQLAGERAVALSAGVAPWDHLHPVAVRLMPGRGTLDWARFMAGLIKTGYTGPLMLEAGNGFHGKEQAVPGFLEEAMAAWRRMRGKLT